MELKGFIRNAVLAVLAEEVRANGKSYDDPEELLVGLSELDKVAALQDAFDEGYAVKFMVLHAVEEQGFMPLVLPDHGEMICKAISRFENAINKIISEKGQTCSKPTAILALLEAFTIGRRLVPSGDMADELRTIEIIQRAKRAGKASGVKRAKTAANTWEPIALKLALSSRKVNGRWSQDDVASYVSGQWTSKIKCPSHKTLKDGVSRWIKEGKLPEKVR